ncbi:hypothetical protein JQN58_12910 [Aneurinibacillus sp. BA2021]|nr:hypothetical protein [Aneurinibacillus sp. BA2021]
MTIRKQTTGCECIEKITYGSGSGRRDRKRGVPYGSVHKTAVATCRAARWIKFYYTQSAFFPRPANDAAIYAAGHTASRRAAAIKDADIILLTIGANDVMKIVRANFNHLTYDDFVREQAAYQIRLQHIIDRIHRKNENAHIYLLGLYNPFDKYFGDIKEMDQIIADWNRMGAYVISQYDQAKFIPIQDIFHGAKENLLYEDNFHPNETGYKRIAERVLQYITPDIVKRDN